MKDVIIGRKHDPLNFTMQAVGLEYFDKEKGKFIMIEANKLDIGENQVTARFADYELGFQMIVFDGDTETSMTMSKYDFKNNRFLEHYKCDFETANIDCNTDTNNTVVDIATEDVEYFSVINLSLIHI